MTAYRSSRRNGGEGNEACKPTFIGMEVHLAVHEAGKVERGTVMPMSHGSVVSRLMSCRFVAQFTENSCYRAVCFCTRQLRDKSCEVNFRPSRQETLNVFMRY